MGDEVLLDTDVLFKTAAYRLAQPALALLDALGLQPTVLGAARFMLAKRLPKSKRIDDRGAAVREFDAVSARLGTLEPTPAEVELAAELEATAIAGELDIDAGETQLLAVLLARGAPLMVTGDKRAVRAVGALLSPLPPHRIACLEQLLGSLADLLGPDALRAAVCAEPAIDTAATAACSCASGGSADPCLGLASYVDDLRGRAPAALCPGYRLPTRPA